MLQTPFHERLATYNVTHLWEHWSGYLAAVKYGHSATVEYFALRDSVGIFDTSPLFKYRISGARVAEALSSVFVRDVGRCPIGGAQYNIWCDDAGYVIEDGVLLRLAENEYWITTAERNLRYFSNLLGSGAVIEEARDQWGILALQGRHSLSVLEAAQANVAHLDYFRVAHTSIANSDVMISRTGFTGDLGYEIWVRRQDSLGVLDALLEAGAGYNIIPVGVRALGMARLEAGLVLLGTDFESARFAWTEADRETPFELGLGWMVPRNTEREYMGKTALEAERATVTSRWKTTGIILDAADYERTYNEAGLIAPKEGVYHTGTMSLYDADFNTSPGANYVGYVTSFMFSPILKRHIGLAKIPLDRLQPGSELFLEIGVSHRPKYVRAAVASTPFYDPARKTAAHMKEAK